jgi:hypothetical protein
MQQIEQCSRRRSRVADGAYDVEEHFVRQFLNQGAHSPEVFEAKRVMKDCLPRVWHCLYARLAGEPHHGYVLPEALDPAVAALVVIVGVARYVYENASPSS